VSSLIADEGGGGGGPGVGDEAATSHEFEFSFYEASVLAWVTFRKTEDHEEIV
jgi:hypothetical protein